MFPPIRLLTEIPGPRSRELMALREAVVARGVGCSVPVFAESASGMLVTDVDGNVLIDFARGIGTLNAGHYYPAVVAAAREQLGRLMHTCFTVAHYEPVALAEALGRLTPGGVTLLTNSSVETVDNAVMIARHATGRGDVLVFEHGFHGRTLLALTLTCESDPTSSASARSLPSLSVPLSLRIAPAGAVHRVGAAGIPREPCSAGGRREAELVTGDQVLSGGGVSLARLARTKRFLVAVTNRVAVILPLQECDETKVRQPTSRKPWTTPRALEDGEGILASAGRPAVGINRAGKPRCSAHLGLKFQDTPELPT